MVKIVQEIRCELGDGELLALDAVRGQELTCITGELWLTLDGVTEDIILGQGQCWRVPHKAPLVVSALKPSVFVATQPGRSLSRRATRAGAEALLARLLRWRHAPLAGYPALLVR